MYASRTAEVAICIILERTARSLPTVIVRLKMQVVEENVCGVIVLGIECFVMVVRLDICIVLLHENNIIFRYRGRHSSASRTVGVEV